ncbi:MAG: SPOR domain-containing protein [Bacteroidales bacterium]|nr:SPOR domain-containing protein [Bacteroidales bacterium]
MKRIFVIFTLLMLGGVSLRAQDTTRAAPVDSTLIGKSILSVLGPGVQLEQSAAVRQALENYTRSNADKPINGYRIRVFYDNGPQARAKSESIEQVLRKQFPETGVYRSFESPNYKVSIGDFRSKDEALRIFNALKGAYPTAFIIKESINYPR